MKMGYLKLLHREDERQAAVAGLMTKQLTQPSIEKHLGDFGVDPESASHAQINQLSGGMKVNVVLAASMWQNPHILIREEPTNCSDQKGLSALLLSIKDYKGSVLVISHNKKFCDGIATEKWIMKSYSLQLFRACCRLHQHGLQQALRRRLPFHHGHRRTDSLHSKPVSGQSLQKLKRPTRWS